MITTSANNRTYYSEYGVVVDVEFEEFKHQCPHKEIVQIHDEFGYCTQCGQTIGIIDKRG